MLMPFCNFEFPTKILAPVYIHVNPLGPRTIGPHFLSTMFVQASEMAASHILTSLVFSCLYLFERCNEAYISVSKRFKICRTRR